MTGQENSKKWDVFVYGDVNIDLVIPGVDRFPLPGQEEEVAVMETLVGGGAALFALGIGKLGLRPAFQGMVGDDCYGRMIREEFAARQVDTSLLSVSRTQKTGISISFTNQRDRSFLTMRGTNDSLDLSNVSMEAARQARHIHVTGYAGSANHDAYLSLLQRVKRETDATVSFDLGWDDSGEWKREIDQLFPYIDVLFMNETEAVHYARADTALEAGRIFARDCPVVAIKLGAKGALGFAEGKVCRREPFRVRAVDTTGAGDSFNAGFVYGYLTGKDLSECLSCGNACGALSVTALGGNTAFPDRAGLEAFLADQGKMEDPPERRNGGPTRLKGKTEDPPERG